MILGLKHVGAILNVWMQKFHVYALVGVLIKWLYEMHGAMIKAVYSLQYKNPQYISLQCVPREFSTFVQGEHLLNNLSKQTLF